jgi:hypothetical protein
VTRLKKLLIGLLVVVAVIATSAGTTVATVYLAPELLPEGEQGPMGPRGDRGERGLPGKDGVDGVDGASADTSDASSASSFDEDLAPNGMHMPEYRAYCDDLYQKWQDGRSMSGGSDDEGDRAIQEYGQALCDQ